MEKTQCLQHAKQALLKALILGRPTNRLADLTDLEEVSQLQVGQLQLQVCCQLQVGLKGTFCTGSLITPSLAKYHYDNLN